MDLKRINVDLYGPKNEPYIHLRNKWTKKMFKMHMLSKFQSLVS